MTRKEKDLVKPLLAGIVGWLMVAVFIIKIPPSQSYVEALVFVVFSVSGYLIFRSIIKRSRPALAVMVFIGGLLLLNRLGYLDILTGMLVVIISLLISFIN